MSVGISFPRITVKPEPLENHYNSSKPFKTLFYLYRQNTRSLVLAG